jgi:hypothetical protein
MGRVAVERGVRMGVTESEEASRELAASSQQPYCQRHLAKRSLKSVRTLRTIEQRTINSPSPAGGRRPGGGPPCRSSVHSRLQKIGSPLRVHTLQFREPVERMPLSLSGDGKRLFAGGVSLHNIHRRPRPKIRRGLQFPSRPFRSVG